jgi:hypothetical protein
MSVHIVTCMSGVAPGNSLDFDSENEALAAYDRLIAANAWDDVIYETGESCWTSRIVKRWNRWQGEQAA